MAIVNTHYDYCGKGKHSDLPGTWVLKDVLSAPENGLNENLTFRATSSTGKIRNCTRVYTEKSGGKNYLQYNAREGNGIFYNFTYGFWAEEYKTWFFYDESTASTEFMNWLVNNATKQS